MAEKLYPLDIPPGLYRNGTKLESTGRWYDGNLVRFYQKTKQPIGGWVARTTTGATISGTPNAMISWQDNAGASWLAIGTTTHLYVVNGSNVVSDITPTVGFSLGGNPATWQLDVFGSYLVATFNGAGTNPSGDMNAYYWAGNPASPAVQDVATVTDAPFLFHGLVATPERFLFLLRGSDPLTLGGGTMRTFRAQQGGAIASAMVD